MARTEDQLNSELESVAGLSLQDLRAYWGGRWRDPAPGFRARDQLGRAIAYRLQADALGGLPRAIERQLAELAKRFETDRGFTPGPKAVLKPGSTLIREWGGRRHEVAVIERGFLYDGEQFASLSQLAQRITGAKWNGPVFFGVRPPKNPAAQGRRAAL